jgi:HlyD family secretion protein
LGGHRTSEGWFVFVAEDGTARERAVTVTRRSGQSAAVSDGVRPGDAIVVYPPSTLSDGAAIRVR